MEKLKITQSECAILKSQKPLCIWFTGLPCSGKTTLAHALEKRLEVENRNKHTYILDGDVLRKGLNRDLGFTTEDRNENIRRAAEVARLMVDTGLVVIASFITPYKVGRQMARNLFSVGEFVEIYLDTSLSECELRDVKGMYAKARRGELKNFTGIDSIYEVPENPELILNTQLHSIDECVEKILALILKLE